MNQGIENVVTSIYFWPILDVSLFSFFCNKAERTTTPFLNTFRSRNVEYEESKMEQNNTIFSSTPLGVDTTYLDVDSTPLYLDSKSIK